MTGIIDNSSDEARKQWCDLLHAGWMHHQQQVKEMQSPIIGAKPSEEQIFHMAVSVAMQDAIALIQQMEAYGYFDEGDGEEGDDLPQHSRGPAG
ncbi:MAG TPA: hypothetical protein DCX27_16255 [Balneola sp.]|nr:hypothetical protein [Balneola sp.]